MSARIIPFPTAERRRRMADALLAASRCLRATAEAENDAERQALERAARRYLGRFEDISAGRVA